MEADFFFFDVSLINTHVNNIEITHIAGKAKNTPYHANKAINEPNIGDNTFPNPFEASTNPNTLLSWAPLKRSPVNAIAIGAVPAAPIPCKLYRLVSI